MKSHLKWNPLSQSLFIWQKVFVMMILTGWQTFWLIKCRKIMVMAGMHLYKEKGKAVEGLGPVPPVMGFFPINKKVQFTK